MHRKWALLILPIVAPQLFAQLPEFYKKVDRVTWVVSDADKVAEGWKNLGADEVRPAQLISLNRTQYRGKQTASTVKVAAGRIGTVQIRWIQPVRGKNAYADFLARHGNGVFSLVHRVPSKEALAREIQRLAALGVGVLEQGEVSSALGSVSYAYMDTEKGGKYSLGLVAAADAGSPNSADSPKPNMQLSQFAFVAHDLRAVSDYWKKLGFPEMSYTHPPLRDLVYRGSTGQFDQELGWQRHGQIVYEWILPLKGPTTYLDHMKVHGEGFHHFAFDVGEIDRRAALLGELGFPRIQSGAWGEEGKRGSGRFAYIDTSSIGGVAIELLWNSR